MLQCGVRVAGHLQEVRADGLEPVVSGHRSVHRVKDRQARGRPLGHGGRDRAVEGHDGASRHLLEQAVQGEDLRPIGVGGRRRAVVDGRDRRLQLVLADATTRHGAVQEGRPPADHLAIPQGPILVGERHDLPIGRRPGWTAGIDQEHERQQPGDLGIVGELAVDHASRGGSPRPTGRPVGGLDPHCSYTPR